MRECWYCEVAVTTLEVTFFYGVPPGEAEARALDQVRRVCGFRDIRWDEQRRAIEVEYDASRLNEPDIAALLAKAGFELRHTIRAAI
jgi:hypothetical protein